MKRLLTTTLAILSMFGVILFASSCSSTEEEEEHTHNLTHVEAVDATCTTDGNLEYWYCSECNTYFLDEDGTETTRKVGITISATGHTEEEVTTITKEATSTEHGTYDTVTICSVCNEELSSHVTGDIHYYNYENPVDVSENTHTFACEISGCDNELVESHNYSDIDDEGKRTCEQCSKSINYTPFLEYDFDDDSNTATVISIGEASDTEIVIPSQITNGSTTYTVTEIADKAFYYATTITSVSIPDTITIIGSQSFRGCTSLTEITISDNVVTLGDYAFYYCTSLESVTLGSGITSIGNYTFYNCSSLTEITIPTNVATIGDYAFANCTALESIDLSSVTSIGNYAFWWCTSLTEITIPSSVTTLGSNAFNSCRALETVIIGTGIEEIGSSAFYNCTSLSVVSYSGSETDWAEVSVGANNTRLTNVLSYSE